MEGLKRANCLSSLHSVNSCYMGSVRRFKVGDQLRLARDLTNNKVIVGPQETYFGLTKLCSAIGEEAIGEETGKSATFLSTLG